jgi:GNAT superfamily N-acetyltransferase
MDAPKIQVRDMRPDEYEAYTAQRERDTAESLSPSMPYEQGLAEARQGTARFLPDGLATPGHRLLAAENADGDVVGHAWLGLADPRTGSPESAWLYDIRVGEAHRRRGYGDAMLAEIERIAREAGARTLGLNVFGRNRTAIALYTARGYDVTTQQMHKPLAAP